MIFLLVCAVVGRLADTKVTVTTESLAPTAGEIGAQAAFEQVKEFSRKLAIGTGVPEVFLTLDDRFGSRAWDCYVPEVGEFAVSSTSKRLLFWADEKRIPGDAKEEQRSSVNTKYSTEVEIERRAREISKCADCGPFVVTKITSGNVSSTGRYGPFACMNFESLHNGRQVAGVGGSICFDLRDGSPVLFEQKVDWTVSPDEPALSKEAALTSARAAYALALGQMAASELDPSRGSDVLYWRKADQRSCLDYVPVYRFFFGDDCVLINGIDGSTRKVILAKR